MAYARSGNVKDDGSITTGNFVIIEPEKWVGKLCPILSHIDIGERLKAGNWFVILFSHSCTHCIEAMPKYLQIAHNISAQGADVKIALIQIPPVGKVDSLQHPLPRSIVTGQLESSRDWFAETPVEMQLENGKVVQAITKGEGLVWVDKKYQK